MNKEEFEALQVKFQDDPDYFDKQLTIEDANAAKTKANNEAAATRIKLKEANDKLTAIESAKMEQEALLKEKEDEKLAKKGEFEALFNAKDSELKKSTETNKSLMERLTAFEERENRLKEQMIEKLPEDKREQFKDLSLDQIRTVVEMTSNQLTQTNSDMVTTPLDASKEEITGEISPEKFKAMSWDQQMAYVHQKTKDFKGR